MSRVASQRSQIDPFYVMEIVAAAAKVETATGDVLHLEVGQPSTGAPRLAVAAAIELLELDQPLGYTPACGIDPLRSRVAGLYSDRYDIEIDPARVIITAGASAAVVLAMLASFDVGDRVAIAEPGYPCYRQIMTALGLEPVTIRVGADDHFLLGAKALELAHQDTPLAGVIVASPANPTGSVYDDETLHDVLAWCTTKDVRLISDEIYHGISFERPVPTAWSESAKSIVIGSFSKYFSMTGWRLGWMIVPDELIDPIDRLAQNFYLSPPTLAQYVGWAALDSTDELEGHVDRYRANREIMLEALDEMGITEIAPCDGAFYLYGNVSQWGIDSAELTQLWLSELGVATAAGIDFDKTRGDEWVRWSLAGSTEDIGLASRRLVEWARRQSHAAADG